MSNAELKRDDERLVLELKSVLNEYEKHHIVDTYDYVSDLLAASARRKNLIPLLDDEEHTLYEIIVDIICIIEVESGAEEDE